MAMTQAEVMQKLNWLRGNAEEMRKTVKRIKEEEELSGPMLEQANLASTSLHFFESHITKLEMMMNPPQQEEKLFRD